VTTFNSNRASPLVTVWSCASVLLAPRVRMSAATGPVMTT
jgi:hypothetical protein